ncbi:RHS repeat-associated core domain-containing protein [Streptomyces sp. NPDC001401]|uniref:RHS repeat-associated core domain-containing protein n=1 Tax=Streptomyces sp. NPDC001401 TaxID=3364570 RepID=UPI003682815E
MKKVKKRPDAVAAMMAARKQHHRVEVLSDRTPFAQTFANPNGTLTYQASAEPRWVKKSGSWVRVDPTLVKNRDGSWAPKAAEPGLKLSGGGNTTLATMDSRAGSLSLSWPSKLPTPKASGASATYPNVLPGVDLVLTANAAGSFEEVLVVKNRAAAANKALTHLTLGMSASKGLTVKSDKHGNVKVKTAKGSTVFKSPAPTVWDSTVGKTDPTKSTVVHPGQGAHRAPVGVSIAHHGERLKIPSSFLSASATKYPVFVDPSYTVGPTWLSFVEVQSAYPTASDWYWTFDGNMSVGYDGGGIDRSYYSFGLPGDAYGATSKVLSATVTAEVTKTDMATSASHSVNLYSTGSISNATTWNNQPTQLAGPATATFTTSSTAPDTNVSWDVGSYVESILTASTYTGQFTAGLINQNETDTNGFVAFSQNPTFTLTYDHTPWPVGTTSFTPDNPASNGKQYSSSATPTFSASTTDADSDTLQYQIQVLSGSSVVASGASSFVASGATGSWTPTSASALANGDYTFKVRAYDGTEYSSWSAATAFTVDVETPAKPGISCSGYTAGAWHDLISGGTTCTFSDTSSYVEGYSYGLRHGSDPVTWKWTTGSQVTINPTASGLYTLEVSMVDDAGVQSDPATYTFGVGSSAMLSPADGSQTSAGILLKAAAPDGYTKVTFKYRLGTSGAFQDVPSEATFDCGCSNVWPVATVGNAEGVQSPYLTWKVTESLSDDGPIQLKAVFTNDSGSTTVTTDPVTTTLDRLGSGVDFGTTTVGPVTVGLQSGNGAVSATDVSIANYGSGLGVSRTFNSLNPHTNSIFGPGWTSSLPVAGTSASWSSITDNGSYALLTGSDGSTLAFDAGTTTGGVTSYTPLGSAAANGFTLTKSSAGFNLSDSTGTQVVFKTPAGGSSGQYLPSTVTQPGSSRSTGYTYDSSSSSSTYGKLMLVVAPDAAVSQSSTTACPYPATSSSWSTGCRGLKLNYDSTTGNVSEIDFLTSDGTDLTSTPVAKYSYDSSGRLVAEWDPRTSPDLKTTYAYDETTGDADLGRLTQISPAQSTPGSLAPWVLAYNDTASSSDYGKLAYVSRTHNTANGGLTAKSVIAYSVPLTVSAGGPADMDAATVATWGQSDVPTSAVAVFPPDHAPTSAPPSDWTYAQIHYYDADGREVNTASYTGGWKINTTEYDSYGNDVRELSAANRATALAAGANSAGVARQLDTETVYSADGTQPLDSYGPAHQANAAGDRQLIRTHTHQVYDEGAPNNDQDANGNPYGLVTTQAVSASLGAAVPGNGDVDGRTTRYKYDNGSGNEGWTLRTPLQTVTDPGTGHLNITKTVAFNEDSSLYGGEPLQVASSQPSDTAQTGAGTTKTIYYTAGTNSVDGACGNQPVWADLICKTKPAAQPNTSGLASLQVTTYTYNVYLQPLTKTETYTAADGTTATRITTTTYDAAGRTTRSAVSTTGTGMGSAVAPAKTVYSSTTGLPTDLQSLDSSGNATADLATSYDDFGDPSSYTDATGRVTNYTYDLAERVISRSNSGDTTTYTYNGGSVHDGSLTSETDAQAGTFGAGYGPDGNLVTETYPGGTTATYTFDATGTATSLTYTNSNWSGSLTDSVQTNDAGDWTNRSEMSTTKTYSYDAADRLTAVADTQSGQCTTRAYGYEADSNRTKLTTSAPKADGTCQTSTSSIENHAYDAADRITDAGYTYDTLGDITTTPSADAGGSGDLTAGYYANGMLASQTQAGNTSSWTLDPTGTRVSTTTVASSGITFTNDYANQSDKPDLITASNGAWTRNVLGPDDHLAATVTASGVSLQLMDLHGDLMATEDLASNSVTSTNTYTEFGLVEAGPAASYGWAAGAQRESTGQAGQILMGVRGYNPYLGRFDQRDPVPGGSANAYDFADQNPVNNSDTSGRWTFPHGHATCGYTTCTFYLSHWGSNHLYNLMADWGWSTAAVGAAVGALLGLAMCEGNGYCAALIAGYFGWMTSAIIDAADRAHNHHICFAMKTSFPTWTGIGIMFYPLYPESVGGRNCW